MSGASKPWLSVEALPPVRGLPDFGWRVSMQYTAPETAKPFTMPRFRQLLKLLPMSIRTMLYIRKKRRERKLPFIDVLRMVPYMPIYGVPIGGIGSGSIGRGYRGEFCRFQMVPGIYEHETVHANQFIVCVRKQDRTVFQQVLSPRSCKPPGEILRAWNWELEDSCATYHALYPRAWTVYEIPGQSIRLVCRQISPVMPHEYKDSSLPAAVFVWTVENENPEDVEVSIMFTFKNGQGTKQDRTGGVSTKCFRHSENNHPVSGVMIRQNFRDMPCTYIVAAACKNQVEVSTCAGFDPNSSGKDIWEDLFINGQLKNTESEKQPTSPGQEVCVAVCARTVVSSNQTSQLDFSLTWHMPVIQFGGKETTYHRRYSNWFGVGDEEAIRLTSYALNNYAAWEAKIEEWQNPILHSKNLPSWYKSALFNELYFVSDGGTVWLNADTQDSDVHGHVKEYGKFAYLEGHEYRMYNTYDVHHYASFALVSLWPNLQLSLQYDIAEAVEHEIKNGVRFLMENKIGQVKVSGAVPHDIGDPEEEPWKNLNAYIMHPTDEWKDLNTKFILQIYRDYAFTHDMNYLTYMYPRAKRILESCLRWDKDGDGLIENDGFADQTFDAWMVTGASAYCGNLWLAALHMMSEMASLLENADDKARYEQLLESAKDAYEKKLWNGRYYNYDSSNARYHDSVMADQLNGHWFLKASGVKDDTVLPKEHVVSALKTVFELNVLSFRNGTMGAINGMRPNGKKDITSLQSEEFWPGVIYGLAATMIQEGLLEEGFQTAYGAYHTIYKRLGLGFQTPEGYTEESTYRSLGYMRPLAIWAIQHALQKYHDHLLNEIH